MKNKTREIIISIGNFINKSKNIPSYEKACLLDALTVVLQEE